ncbi:MAG: rhodanese-like domain-containing protein [Thiobacillus sp.]|nr:rhodanese-like domain-containing protein [Thiobacillus sp.]
MKKNLLKLSGLALALAATIGMSGCASNGNTAATPDKPLEVAIAAGLPSVDVMHNGQKVSIQRNQKQDNTINPDFAKTSRKCPPFCIQPGVLAPGVKTIGELEVIHYLKKMSDGDTSIMVVDSRTPDWVEKGTIPGAINIPWDKLNIGKSDPITVQEILEKHFGVKNQDGFNMFDNAKTVVMFCNGQWCGQSPTNIKGLLKIGYPAEKIKWYRGGMQEWEALGLTTVKPAK